MNRYMKVIAGALAVVLVSLCACKAEGELYEKNNGSDSVITITTQPETTTNVTVGSISCILSVSASVTQSATLSYQWYNNTSNSNTGGTTITDATGASFTIPVTLSVGIYYYFCEVLATGGATPVRTTVAIVNVAATSGFLPTITTNVVSNITANSATLGGNITNAGSPAYTERGMVYATTEIPTTSNNKKIVTGTGTGSFSTDISGLTANTTYYVRAYVINSQGTAYGNLEGFTTLRSGVWTQKAANFAGKDRYCAVGFSIGNKGYYGTGSIDSNNSLQDFWEYDPVSNSWTQKANFVEEGRTRAVGFSIGNKGYIGTGFCDGGGYRQDFWEYDPVTNIWTQKANFAGGNRTDAVGFSIDNRGYIGTGFRDGIGYLQDFWEYDPASNVWTQKANFAGEGRCFAVGFSIGNKGYIGTGESRSSHQDFWEYNPISNSWTQKANFAGGSRWSAVGFSIGNKGYIGTGLYSNYLQDFWEYDPVSNSWTQKANFAGESRYDAVGFSIGNKGYIGIGIGSGNANKYLRDLWEFTP